MQAEAYSDISTFFDRRRARSALSPTHGCRLLPHERAACLRPRRTLQTGISMRAAMATLCVVYGLAAAVAFDAPAAAAQCANPNLSGARA